MTACSFRLETQLEHVQIMKSYFHFSSSVEILFKGWETKTYGEMCGSVIAIFVFCILFELFKGYRENVMKNSQDKKKHGISENNEETSLLNNRPREPTVTWSYVMDRLYHTLLHVLNLFLGYLIMLTVMTYNAWLFLAVIFGCALGFYSVDVWRSIKIQKKLERKPKNAPETSCHSGYGAGATGLEV